MIANLNKTTQFCLENDLGKKSLTGLFVVAHFVLLHH
jgi:hypothetical protein